MRLRHQIEVRVVRMTTKEEAAAPLLDSTPGHVQRVERNSVRDVADISDLREGSRRTLKSVELKTEGTRTPSGRPEAGDKLAIAVRNSRAMRRLSSVAGREFQLLGRRIPRSLKLARDPSAISMVATSTC